MTTTHSTAVVIYDPERADPEKLALAGFLGGFRGLTREAYDLDLRQFVSFVGEHDASLFQVRRADADADAYGRELEARGKARATVARRLCIVAGFYRYAEEEGLIAHSPAVHVRRPRPDYESYAVGLDRNEVGALLVAAGLGPAREHALMSLLTLNGLRVSEVSIATSMGPPEGSSCHGHGSSHANAANTARSAGSSAGRWTWRRMTAGSWRSMTTSTARSVSLRQMSRMSWRKRQNAR